jgi:hypothetical protein
MEILTNDMKKEITKFKLSPSSLSLMQECPRCFWLTQHKVWKRPSGIFPSLPSGMDSILKKHFDKFCEKGLLPLELRKENECKGCKLFDDFDLLKDWRSNFKGISYSDKEGNILHGAIDNLLVKDKKLIILDFKTRGFPCKEDTQDTYQNQINIYNFLLKENGYDVENYGILLFYYPKEVLDTGEVKFETELKKMSVSIKDAESIFNRAIKLLNSECPEDTCDWCKGG